MEFLIPQRDIERYQRNTAICEDYNRMVVEEVQISENQKHTRLAAKYDISVSMVRKIIDGANNSTTLLYNVEPLKR